MKFKLGSLTAISLFLLATGCSQEKYIAAEGYYDQSGFELAGGLYLLKNKMFYYSTSFGNADLTIYGEYEISLTNALTFHPDKKLMQEFNVYGTASGIQTDKLVLIYKQPHREYAKELVVKTDLSRVTFPEFTSASRTVSTTVSRPVSKQLELEYVNPRPSGKHKNAKIELTESITEILIYHNYYAEMVKQFKLNSSFVVQDGQLISDDQKEIKKTEIANQRINQIVRYIEQKRSNLFKPSIRDKKEYTRLILID